MFKRQYDSSSDIDKGLSESFSLSFSKEKLDLPKIRMSNLTVLTVLTSINFVEILRGYIFNTKQLHRCVKNIYII